MNTNSSNVEPAARAGKTGFSLSLKGRALRLLAGREYSRAELERKLAQYEETPGQLAEVLDELQAKDFISEARAPAAKWSHPTPPTGRR